MPSAIKVVMFDVSSSWGVGYFFDGCASFVIPPTS